MDIKFANYVFGKLYNCFGEDIIPSMLQNDNLSKEELELLM